MDWLSITLLGARGQDKTTDGGRRHFRSLSARAQARPRVPRARAWIKDNKLFALVLVPALLLRLDAELGYGGSPGSTTRSRT